MSIIYSPAYYNQKESVWGNKTNWSTPGPVSKVNAFYQEKQSGGKCSLHSMNAFMGKQGVTVEKIIPFNNQIEKEAAIGLCGDWGTDHTNPVNFQVAKQALGMTVNNISQLDQKGITPKVVQKYLEKNKESFNLPKDAEIKITEGAINSIPMQQAIAEINAKESNHRAIVGVNGKHYIAVRKTKENQWRVIDSMTNSHKQNADNVVERIQPSFSSLKNAIAHAVNSHAVNHPNGNVQLIYPSKDVIPTLSPTEKGVVIGGIGVGIGVSAYMLYKAYKKYVKS